MLAGALLTATVLGTVHSAADAGAGSGVKTKPCSFPIPLELPYRNERADQCWLRIEDVELTETVTVWCYIAHAFLKNYIHDYNSKKMIEDNVDVTLWSEDARPQDDIVPKDSDQRVLKDWKLTTILDPTTHMRLYVSKAADCRLIMYTREGTSNYRIDCERILFYVNERLYGKAAISRARGSLLSACVFIIFASIHVLL